MEILSKKFIFSEKINCYRIYTREISNQDYIISGNIEYLYLLKGDILIKEANKELSLEKGDVYVIAPWKEVIISSESPNLILVLEIVPDCVESYYKPYEFQRIYTGMVINKNTKNRISSNMRILLKHSLKKSYTDDIIIKVLESLIHDVKKDLEFKDNNEENNNIRNIIVSITKEIPKRIIEGEDFSLKTFSKEYNLSYYYLSKQFKEVIGVNYTDYLSTIQMNIFLKKLINNEDSITSIALQSGYRNISNLNKDFKKNFDSSPTEFKKICLKEYKEYICSIDEVRDFLEEGDVLEEFYLNGEVMVDLRCKNEFTNRTMTNEDIKMSLVRAKDFIGKFENTRVRLMINYSDYYYVLSLEDQELALFLARETREIISLCIERNIEMSVDYTILKL